MDKIRIFTRSIAAGMASLGCLFPSFGEDTKVSVKTDAPDVGLDAAFSDVGEAFRVASDSLQAGIDSVSK